MDGQKRRYEQTIGLHNEDELMHFFKKELKSKADDICVDENNENDIDSNNMERNESNDSKSGIEIILREEKNIFGELKNHLNNKFTLEDINKIQQQIKTYNMIKDGICISQSTNDELDFNFSGDMFKSVDLTKTFSVLGSLKDYMKPFSIHNDNKFEEISFIHSLKNYKDVVVDCVSLKRHDIYQNSYIIHMLNHAYRSRKQVLKNNNKIQHILKANSSSNKEFLDQGFSRPRVLLILPMKNSCFKVLKKIYSIFHVKKFKIINGQLIKEEYGESDDHKTHIKNKPYDFQWAFAGNTDDCFKIGISFPNSREIRFFSDLYSSDIIIASPLGIKMLIGTDSEPKDYDFLSSIELLIIDQLDVLLMQNWEHILDILKYMNKLPLKTNNTDFSRLYHHFSNELGRYYRQSIALSTVSCPEIYAIFKNMSTNYEGNVIISNSSVKGSLSKISIEHPIFFYKFQCSNYSDSSSMRLDFFKHKFLPDLKKLNTFKVAIFVSNYLEFVLLRNCLRDNNVDMATLTEYSDAQSRSRMREMFKIGQTKLLLITERFHFYYRPLLAGVDRVIFYQLPIHCHFFNEIASRINFKSNDTKISTVKDVSDLDTADSLNIPFVSAIFSDCDHILLKNIIGTSLFQGISDSSQNKTVFMFST